MYSNGFTFSPVETNGKRLRMRPRRESAVLQRFKQGSNDTVGSNSTHKHVMEFSVCCHMKHDV